MAGKKPLFISAPRLILGVAGSDGLFNRIGFAIGLNLNVSVRVEPVFTLGSYGPVSYETLQYQPVTGTFQIIRLQPKKERDARISNAKLAYADTKNNNFVGDPSLINSSVAKVAVDEKGKSDVDNNVVQQNGLYQHLDPQTVISSSTFDIKIYMNLAGFGDQAYTRPAKVGTTTGETDDANGVAGTDVVHFMTIQDCRLTSRSVNISAGQLLNEPLNFMGLLAINGANAEQLDTGVKGI